MTAMRPPVAGSQVVGDVRRPDQLEHDVEGPWSVNEAGSTAVAPSAATSSRRSGFGPWRPPRSPATAISTAAVPAAGGAVDADPLADRQLAVVVVRVVRGGVVLGEAAGTLPADALGHGHGHDLGDDRELRLPGAGDDGHHPVADTEPADAGSRRHDHARKLEARQLGRGRARRGRVVAVPLHDVARLMPAAALARAAHRCRARDRGAAPQPRRRCDRAGNRAGPSGRSRGPGPM